MINIKSNAITRNVQYSGPRREFTVWQTQWQLERRGYMLAYCVFNATSAAVSLYQPLPSR